MDLPLHPNGLPGENILVEPVEAEDMDDPSVINLDKESAGQIGSRVIGEGVERLPGSSTTIGVKSVAMSDGNMGCPHEEGKDFPEGEDCPFCRLGGETGK